MGRVKTLGVACFNVHLLGDGNEIRLNVINLFRECLYYARISLRKAIKLTHLGDLVAVGIRVVLPEFSQYLYYL